MFLLRKFGIIPSKSIEAKPGGNLPHRHHHKKDTEGSHKRKIKSEKDSNFSSKRNQRRHSPREHHCSRQKKSSETIRRRRRRESPTHRFVSQTEIYYISPEDIKRIRKDWNKHQKEVPEVLSEKRRHKSYAHDTYTEKRESLKRETDATKLLKHKYKDTTDYHQRPTKKESVKLIPNKNEKEVSKKTSIWSNFWKRSSLFEKPESSHDNVKHLRKTNRPAVDDNNRTSEKYKAPVESTKKTEKVHRKKHKENPVAACTQKLKKPQRKNESENNEVRSLKSKSTIPERPCFSLIKSTFPVVEIPASAVNEDFLNSRKKRQTFEKHYTYDKTNNRLTSNTSTIFAFSDSDKLYAETSESYSVDATRKNTDESCKIPTTDFKIETKVLATVSNTKPLKSCKEIKTPPVKLRKSRIPILSKISKTVASAKEGLTSYRGSPRKTLQVIERGIDTKLTKSPSFKSKPEPKEKIFCQDDSQIAPTVIKQCQIQNQVKKESRTSGTPEIKEKIFQRGNSKINKPSTVRKQSQITEKTCETKTTVDIQKKKESRTSITLTTSKPNKTKSEIKNESGKARISSQSQKKHLGTTTQIIKPPEPTATSFKSVTSSNKSKSNTQEKCKSLSKTSSRISLNKSTCGDKSVRSPITTIRSVKSLPQDKKVQNLTVEKPKMTLKQPERQSKIPKVDKNLPKSGSESPDSDKFKELFEASCSKSPDSDKFKNFFEASINKILNENDSFLKKDFTSTLYIKPKSSDEISSDNFFP